MLQSESDFIKLSQHINEHWQMHEKNVKKYYAKSRILALSDFYAEYQNEIHNINAEITPVKDDCSIKYISETLQIFDEYPSNITKPKKHQQLMRANSSTLKNSSSLIDGLNLNQEKDISPVGNTSNQRKLLKASEIYNDFKKFLKSYQQLEVDLKNDCLAKEYDAKLMQLKVFAKNLDRQLPGNNVEIQPAFTTAQENSLRELEKNLSVIHFIQQNKQMFKLSIENIISNPRLNAVLNLLTIILKLINVYNTTQ